ncbi:MAG: ComF family protein [Candidatus Limivicinus sp.]|nr:ComF family protein [Candidatus Limivicinus sp.]
MKVVDWLLDLIYPPRCAFCRRLLSGREKGVCRFCRPKLPYVPADGQVQHFRNVDKCLSPLYYHGSVKDSLHRYKFGGATAYADIYSEFIVKCIDENQISCDSITWVPLSRRRLRRRGYDQAELLAKLIAKHLGQSPVRLLKKQRDTPPQSKTGSVEKRRANIAGAYACLRPELVQGKQVLLVDDIVTTGATLSEAARVLKKAGAKEVICATLARSLR